MVGAAYTSTIGEPLVVHVRCSDPIPSSIGYAATCVVCNDGGCYVITIDPLTCDAEAVTTGHVQVFGCEDATTCDRRNPNFCRICDV